VLAGKQGLELQPTVFGLDFIELLADILRVRAVLLLDQLREFPQVRNARLELDCGLDRCLEPAQLLEGLLRIGGVVPEAGFSREPLQPGDLRLD